MKAVCFFILFFIPITLLAQTIFSGSVNRNAHWSGQVYVDGDVTVAKGVTLFIEPGTRIVFRANFDKLKSGKDPNRVEFVVLGTLVANGLEGEDRIIFTTEKASSQPGSWHGIVLKGLTTTSILKHCLVEFAYKGITCYGSSPAISNCEVRFNQYAGISCEIRSAAQIRSCSLVSNAFAGLICELGSTPLLEKSVITENTNGILIFDRSLPDLGRFAARDGESVGENRISGNIETDVYNRSSYDVYAQNNIWDTNSSVEIQGGIRDKETNPSYGKVLFEPVFGRRPPILSRQFPPAQNTGAEAALLTGNDTDPAVRGSNGNPPQTSPTDFAAGTASPGIPADTVARDTTPPAAVVTPETLIVYREIFIEKPPEEPQVPVITEPVPEWQLDSGGRQYINLARPNYPEIYKRTKFEGKVIMEVVVGRDGEVVSYKVLRSNGEHFTTAAEEALRRMRYRPETFQGQPVQFKIYESFVFKLDE